MEPMHSLLRRQLKRNLPGSEALSAPWTALVGAVNAAYHAFDDDREMLERSLELSSQELLEANSEMRALFQAIPDLLFRVDAQGKILSAKVGAGDDPLLQVQPATRGRTIQNTVLQIAGAKFKDTLPRVLLEKKVQSFEFNFKSGGKILDYEVRLAPVLDREVLVIIRNITEHKQLQEQFLQAQKMEAIGLLAGGVAHDFNNLLMVIQGNLSLLQMDGFSRPTQDAGVALAQRAAQRATELTRQLLTFSRKERVQLKSIELNDVVAEMTRMFQRLVGEHITIQASYSPGGMPILADAGMMEQLLMNLAINARDAMPNGGLLHLATLDTTLPELTETGHPQRRPGRFVHLSVRDTGCGIAPDHLVHIFEPFFTTKEAGKGTGLGLATVFGIVQQHNGWIEVESKVKEGTTFHVYLPRLLAADPTITETRTENPALPRGTESILLVEDEEMVRHLMKKQLERYGYRVHAMESAVTALEFYQKDRPQIDLLITDTVMPGGMNGLELCELMRVEKPGLKVILCSGYADKCFWPNTSFGDTPSFLAKPFNMDELIHRVRERLDSTG